MNLVQPHAAKNRVETATDIEPGRPQMYADPQQLQQVLLNLTLNAVDAMPKGGTLTVGAALDSAGFVITVADTGVGIEPEVLPRIFQPFFTSKKRRGLGLGLPICDRIVKSHGGKIRVDSRPGHGTTFEIRLPLIPPPAGEAARREISSSAALQNH
jgi:signal transduction histidine kinase